MRRPTELATRNANLQGFAPAVAALLTAWQVAADAYTDALEDDQTAYGFVMDGLADQLAALEPRTTHEAASLLQAVRLEENPAKRSGLPVTTQEAILVNVRHFMAAYVVAPEPQA